MEVRSPPDWILTGLACFCVISLASGETESAGLYTLALTRDRCLGATVHTHSEVPGAGFFGRQQHKLGIFKSNPLSLLCAAVFTQCLTHFSIDLLQVS